MYAFTADRLIPEGQGVKKRRAKESLAWDRLNQSVVACDRCPRLIQHCRKVAEEKRAAYREETYWGRPVPNFGDSRARMLIVGLAPGAHGANRTGRMFTGDRSGDWLYKALHKTGFASQASSTSVEDGLQLIDCAITAACHCAPPGNKPTTEELYNCAEWLEQLLRNSTYRVIVALGRIAWETVWKHFKRSTPEQLLPTRKPKFGHGVNVQLTSDIVLLGSYHPSQQNTFTGRLTEPMLNSVFRTAQQLIGENTGGSSD